MNKHAELALLRELATKLGPYSYCGPWLESQIPEIEADMKADLPPAVSWSRCQERYAAALKAAQEIEEKAKETGRRDLARAEARIDALKAEARKALQHLIDKI